jgi:hypothetical protein
MRRLDRRRVVRCGLPINISVDTREVSHDRDDEIQQTKMTIGWDLGDRKSTLCTLDAAGAAIERGEVATN